MKLLFKGSLKSIFSFRLKMCLSLVFSMVIVNNSMSQHLVWQKSVLRNSVNSNLLMKSIDYDESYGFVVTGIFDGTFDFDPGANVQNVTSAASGSSFIMRFDQNGNFDWVKTLDNAYYPDYLKVLFDQNGNIIFKGKCSDVNFDADPGPGFINVSNPAQYFSLILKLDSLGNLMWHQVVEADLETDGMDLDTSGNVYLTGSYSQWHGMSIGSVSIPMGNIYDASASYLAKIDNSGNALWIKSFGESDDPAVNSGNPYAEKIKIGITPQGTICLSGLLIDTVDFDLSTSSSYIVNSVPYKHHLFTLFTNLNGDFISFSMSDSLQYYSSPIEVEVDHLGNFYTLGSVVSFDTVNPLFMEFRKFDFSGNELWMRRFLKGSFRNLDVDYLGNVFFTGFQSEDTIDYDPGPGVFNVITSIVNSYGLGYILKLDSNGNFVKVYTIDNLVLGNAGQFYGYNDFKIGDDGAIYALNSGIEVGNIFKYFEDTCGFTSIISGVQNYGCSQNGVIATSVTGGNPPFSYNWQLPLNSIDSATNTTANQGIQTVIITDSLGCSSSHSVLVNGPSVNSGFDATISNLTNGFAPGFNSSIWVISKNNGCQSVGGSYYTILDTALQYLSASPLPDLISGDTLFWNYTSSNYDSSAIETFIYLHTPSWTSLGQLITLQSSILPLSGDVNTSNNFEQSTYTVVASLDPNDIAVHPIGKCEEGYISPTQKLKYKIRFQNTGTADAVNIFILDSISPLLNLNTIRVLEQSHPMHLEILPGGILKFVFNNIYLADSSSNEPESHGYVIFEIDPLLGLTQGLEIYNKVGIYFDFNPPVYTNQVRNTIYEGDLNALNCGVLSVIENELKPELLIYPNPTNNMLTIQSNIYSGKNGLLQVMDKNGRIVLSFIMDGKQKTIDVASIEAGLYFLVFESANQRNFARFIKN